MKIKIKQILLFSILWMIAFPFAGMGQIFSGQNKSITSLDNSETKFDCLANFFYYNVPDSSFLVFFANESFPPDALWLWDFGDGNTSTEMNPEHHYNTSGIFTVCLTIEDSLSGCSDTNCQEIIVFPAEDCIAAFDYFAEPSDPFTVYFYDFSIGNIETRLWEFGDGTVSREINPVHEYNSPGVFNVCLTIFDNSGFCNDVFCEEININTTPPDCQADFDYFIQPNNLLTVEFTDLSIGDIELWFWDFGDGGVSSEQNPVYEYTQEGTYNVCLVVANNQGTCVSAFCDSLTIQNPDSCIANYTYQILGEEFLSVQFTDLSEGDISQWSWDFGDGTTSNEQNPVHEYAQGGNYNVCLEVTNGAGTCSNLFCDQLTLEIPDYCDADFTHELLENEILTVQFTDLSQGSPNQWLWDFGDGNFSGLQNPLHVYADTGSYTVQLFISHSDSMAYCSDSISKLVTVYVEMPECFANFTMHPDSGVNVPNLFHFYDASENSPEAWLWDFGDGHTSSDNNPSHQYEVGGNYEVTLTVTKYNPWGEDCTDTKTIGMQTPAYFHIGGFVYAGNFPINNPEPTGDTAMVYLYRYHGNKHVVNIDTSMVVENGYFHALFLLEDNYMIKFRLTDGSTNATSYFPSYFGDEVQWLNAPVLSLADSNYYNVNVHLTEVPEHEPGIGMISGFVRHHSNADAQVPARDSEILIFNNMGQALGYVHSSDDGEFGFGNLAFGTYTLYAESAGLFTDPVTVTISEINPSQFDVEIELFNTDITSVDEFNNITLSYFRIFPNPVNEYLNLSITKEINEELIYRLFDYSGREIHSAKSIDFRGSKIAKIDVGGFSKGIYFIHLYSTDMEYSEVQKFIR